jgi:hypothetical protein
MNNECSSMHNTQNEFLLCISASYQILPYDTERFLTFHCWFLSGKFIYIKKLHMHSVNFFLLIFIIKLHAKICFHFYTGDLTPNYVHMALTAFPTQKNSNRISNLSFASHPKFSQKVEKVVKWWIWRTGFCQERKQTQRWFVREFMPQEKVKKLTDSL